MPWRRLRDRNYDPKLKEILPGQTVGFDISWFSLVSLLALQTRVCCLDLQCICYVRLLLRPTQDWKVAGLGSFASSSAPRLRLLLCFSERDVWSRQSSTSFMPCKQSYIHRETKSFASLGRFLEDLLKGTSSLLSQRQITPLRIQLSRLHSGEWERLHVDLLIFNNDFQFSKISIQVRRW